MKKTMFLMALLCLCAVGVFAQAKPDYSGSWTLDKAKSKLDERARIESMTLKAAQTASDLTIATEIKREPRPENAGGGQNAPGSGMGGNRPMGGGRGGMMMGAGDGTTVYKLDGAETIVETETAAGKIPVKTKVLHGNDRLEITTARTFNSPMGEMTLTTKEIWELADGGKTLKINRTTTTPRGDQTSEMVFTKN